MKRLVRLLLVHYDRYGVAAAFAWLIICALSIVVVFVPIDRAIVHLTGVGTDSSGLFTMYFVAPLAVYISPTVWAAVFLISERMWMVTGIHWLMGWEPYQFRKKIGRLAGE